MNAQSQDDLLSARWDPADYRAHSSTQEEWGLALHEQLSLRGDEILFDLGSGDGRLSESLAARVLSGAVVGFDSDPRMVEFAQRHHAGQNLDFVVADVRRFSHERRADAIVSNSCLHWVAEQDEVLRRCREHLVPGGRILFQMGGRGNCSEFLAVASHVAAHPEWAPHFPVWPMPWSFYGPEQYLPWLAETGFRARRCELVPRAMVHDREGLAGWVRTTWMPILERLSESLRPAFIEAVVDSYLRTHPADVNVRTHVAMVRLVVDAVVV